MRISMIRHLENRIEILSKEDLSLTDQREIYQRIFLFDSIKYSSIYYTIFSTFNIRGQSEGRNKQTKNPPTVKRERDFP